MDTITNPRLAELERRAAAGDTFAANARRAYRTDAELEAAEHLAAVQDLSDGGYYVNADGSPFEPERGSVHLLSVAILTVVLTMAAVASVLERTGEHLLRGVVA